MHQPIRFYGGDKNPVIRLFLHREVLYMSTKLLYKEASDKFADPLILNEAWREISPSESTPSSVRKPGPGRNMKTQRCLDTQLENELRALHPEKPICIQICTVLDNRTNSSQNRDLYREIELFTLLDGYEYPDEKDPIPFTSHHWDSPIPLSKWRRMYDSVSSPLYARIGSYIGLDLDTLCKRHRLAGTRYYAMTLPTVYTMNWKENIGITAYVEVELTKSQIMRLTSDKRIRLIQKGESSY